MKHEKQSETLGRACRAHSAGSASPSLSDATFLAQLRAGDRKAELRLVRDHGHWMKRLALRYVKCDTAADDVLQDAFASVFRSIDRFQGRASLKTWLYRVTANASLSYLRKSRRNRETEDIDAIHNIQADALGDWPVCPSVDPFDVLDRKQMCAGVRQMIADLPPGFRDVVHLRDLEEQSTSNVAEALGLSETNVKVRLHRARGRLKTLLSQEPRPSSAGTACTG